MSDITPPEAISVTARVRTPNIVDLPDETPNQSWTLDQLSEYVNQRMESSAALARKSVMDYYRAGRALSYARDKCSRRTIGWREWLKSVNVAPTTAWEAMKLYEKVGRYESRIRHLGRGKQNACTGARDSPAPRTIK